MNIKIIEKLLLWQIENKYLLSLDNSIVNNRFVHLHIKINSSSQLRDYVFDLKTGNHAILDSWTDEKTRETKFDYESINRKD